MGKNWAVAAGVTTLLALGATPGQSAEGLRSDTLQTLGVGARATGLGGAFVAVSEDVTATFWNPAGLASLLQPQLAIDARTLPRATLFLNENLAGTSDINSTDLQFSFAGYAYPLPGGKGTLAFSRTLGGYSQSKIFQPDPADPTLDTRNIEIARYWFNTFAYGTQARLFDRQPGMLRLGVGIHYVELNALTNFRDQTGTREEQGGEEGVTFSVGGLYQPRGETDPLTLGFNYFHPTSISNSSVGTAAFGDRIGGRVSGGAAYRFPEKNGRSVLASVEVRHNFGSADTPGLFERREDTTNVHLGGEYRIRQGTDLLFFRGGFYTRNSSSDSLFYDDRVVTLGAGINKGGRILADLAVEISTEKGDPLLTTSLRYNFGR